MFLRHFNRFVHTGKYLWAAEKSSLATLRKKTGYTFANCKKALELHKNDIGKAEEWLNKQAQALGWSKATKLEGRATKQGLIGVLIKNNIGAMVEVNCETDFVARNENFQKFVSTVSAACTDYVQSIDTRDLIKINLTNEQLKNLPAENGKSLFENLALVIGNVGENASLRRAICFKSNSPIQLFGYAHPHAAVEAPQGVTLFGKYGSIVALKSPSENSDLTKNLCQHIVGMNPVKIGSKTEDKPNEVKDDETCLIYQEFLLNPDVTVDEVLVENHVEIIDFQRFECGENIEEDNNKQPEDKELKKAII